MDRRIADLAANQDGVFGLAQLCELGVGAAAIRARAAAGRLHRLYRGVYSLVPRELVSRNGRFRAAVLAHGPGAALWHRSAGQLQELLAYHGRYIFVIVPTPGGRVKRPGIKLRRSTTLRPNDVTLKDGIPCTTVARTLLDLATDLDQRRIERSIDQAHASGTLDPVAIHEQIEHNAGSPGAAKLSRILRVHMPTDVPDPSEIQDRFLAIARRLNLPEPEQQQYLDLGDGGEPIRADFLWRAQRVIVETDGYDQHGRRSAFESDRVRDQRVLAAGWKPVRTTWRQMGYAPAPLETTLLKLVASPA